MFSGKVEGDRSFKKLRVSFEKSQVYQDFFRGVAYARNWIIQAPEHAFYKAEEIRLQYRLTKIKKKMFDEYLHLGRNMIDGLTGNFPLVSEDEVSRIYQRITALLEEQQRVEAEMEERTLSISSQIKEMEKEMEQD